MQNSQQSGYGDQPGLLTVWAVVLSSLVFSACQLSPAKRESQTPITSITETEELSAQFQERKVVKTLIAIAEAQEVRYSQANRFAATLAQLEITIPSQPYEFSITESNEFEWLAIATSSDQRLRNYGIAGNVLFGEAATFHFQLCQGKKGGDPQVSPTVIGEILECGNDSTPISKFSFLNP